MKVYFIVILILFSCLLNGCGQSGKLYLPNQQNEAGMDDHS